MAHPYTDRTFLDRLIAKGASADAKKVHAYLAQNYPESVLGWVDDATWTLKTVSLSQIAMARRPGGRNDKKTEGIAEAVKAGKKMEPVVLVQEGDKLVVADGYHRTLGFQRAGKKSIQAWVGAGDTESFEHVDMHAAKKNVEPGEKAGEEAQATSMTGLHVHPQSTPIGQAPYTTQPDGTTPGYPMAPVHIQPSDRTLNCRVASTPAARATGFQNTPDPGDAYDAMLFQWPGDQQATLHNKDVGFPVSAVFFDSSGSYVDHFHMQAGDATPKKARAPHRSALEFHTRHWNSLGLGPGSSMSTMGKENDGTIPMRDAATPPNAAPYKIISQGKKFVVKNNAGETKATFDKYDDALKYQRALYVNVPGAAKKADKTTWTGKAKPPKG